MVDIWGAALWHTPHSSGGIKAGVWPVGPDSSVFCRTPEAKPSSTNWAQTNHLILDANLIVSPANMTTPFPRRCKVRGALLDGSIQASTTSSTKKL